MADYSIREVIEMAVQTERLGGEFYRVMTERFNDNKELSALFGDLARKEEIHEKRFTELKGIVGDEEPEDWDQVGDYMRAIVESAFFLGKDKATMHMQNIQDVQGALGFAIAFEKETLLFYHGIKDAVKEKEIIDEIIVEERSHILALNRLKSS